MATPPDLLDAVRREVLRFSVEVEGAAAESLRARGKDDTGDLTKSLYASAPVVEGDRVVGAVGASAPHALVVHEGRRPGAKMPPEGPVAAWAERKLGVAVGTPEGRGRVFLIRRKIGERGVPAVPFLTDPLGRLRPTLAPRVAAAVARALNARKP